MMLDALEIIREEVGAKVAPETELASLAIDSLDYVELLRVLEQAFSVRIPDAADPRTVGDLVSLVNQLCIHDCLSS